MSDIVCYKSGNNPLNGLFQWDIDQKIIVKGAVLSPVPVFNFSNYKKDYAIAVFPEVNNSDLVVTVPNVLLQDSDAIVMHICYDTESDGYSTMYTIYIPVLPRSKPEYYDDIMAEKEGGGAISGDAIRTPVEFSQMTEIITNYLSGLKPTATYTEKESYSISDYLSALSGGRGDRPNGLTVSMLANGTLSLYDADAGSLSESVSAGNKTIYNFTPGVRSHYVNHVNGTISQVGFIKPTGQIRMIYTNYGSSAVKSGNVRDIGGWSADGGAVRYGKIFRGSRFNGQNDNYASEHDKRVFRDLLGVRDEIDLRTSGENFGKLYSAFGSEVDYYHCPVTDSNAYAIVTSSDTIEAYVNAIKRIVTDLKYGRPIYIHCMAGADRTGTLCAIIEALLGVSESDVGKDYELTAFSCNISSGWSGYANRTQTNSNYTGMITNLKGGEAALSDGAVKWAITNGITCEEINTLLMHLVDGNPSLYSSVTNTLTHTTNSSSRTFAKRGTSYSGGLSAESGYDIYSVTVTMGGTDITSTAYNSSTGAISIASVTGDIVITATSISQSATEYSVTNTMTNVSNSNSATTATEGTSYSAALTADSGYYLSSVSVTMGGVDITSTAYTSATGSIYISSVAGAIGITASSTAFEFTDDYRLSSKGVATTTSASGYCLTGYIPINYGDVIRIAGASMDGNTYLCYYVLDPNSGEYGYAAHGEYVTSDNGTIQLHTGTVGGFYVCSLSDGEYALTLEPGQYVKTASNKGDNTGATHVRFGLYGSSSSITITKNQAITS